MTKKGEEKSYCFSFEFSKKTIFNFSFVSVWINHYFISLLIISPNLTEKSKKLTNNNVFSISISNSECEQTTFSFNGRCFTSCPDRSYMLPEKPRLKTKPQQPSQDQPKSSSEMTPVTSTPLRERAVIQTVPQKKCGTCHSSCFRCRGPHSFHCTECAMESSYREVSPNETYCDVNEATKDELKVVKLDHARNGTDDANFSSRTFLQIFIDHFSIFMLIIYIISVTIILIIIRMGVVRFCSNASNATTGNDKKKYAYNRIAYDGNNDHIVMEQELVISASDSSEEIETNK